VSATSKTELLQLRDRFKFVAKAVLSGVSQRGEQQFIKLPTSHFAVKKFVLNWEPFGEAILQAAGFELIGNVYTRDSECTDRAMHVAKTVLDALDVVQLKLDDLNQEKHRAMSGARELCTAKCGFYGDPENDGMCSLCYKKKFGTNPKVSSQRESAPASVSWKVKLEKVKFKSRVIAVLVQMSAESRAKLTANREDFDLSRCGVCNRRLPLAMSAVVCRCGGSFCGKHRSATDHQCDYNFKKANRRTLQEANPSVFGPKIDKI